MRVIYEKVMYDECIACMRSKLESAALTLPEDVMQHIVDWFLAQTRIPKSIEYFGKFFGRLLMSAYPFCNPDDVFGSEIMTLEYWGGAYYPTQELRWKRLFWTNSPRKMIEKMPGAYDDERYADECAQLLDKIKN